MSHVEAGLISGQPHIYEHYITHHSTSGSLIRGKPIKKQTSNLFQADTQDRVQTEGCLKMLAVNLSH